MIKIKQTILYQNIQKRAKQNANFKVVEGNSSFNKYFFEKVCRNSLWPVMCSNITRKKCCNTIYQIASCLETIEKCKIKNKNLNV